MRKILVILDASSELSNDLVDVVSIALTNSAEVERAICNFCNVHAGTFGLSRTLNAEGLSTIRQTFERTYRTVTATKENPHMDDFMILDKQATGRAAKFVTHQGAICVNFAEIVDPTAGSVNSNYFESVRADFADHPAEITHQNASIASDIEVDVESLLARINEEQFEELPLATKEACLAHPSFQVRHFLHDVAKGRQEEAETFLTTTPANTKNLLRTPGVFTDYSGRTFNCTAYEYAYWAKDTFMCRMLEAHMDDETKDYLLTRINSNDESGLTYQQNDEEHRSVHFELKPLQRALQIYVEGYDEWETSDFVAMNGAWLNVGKAQRDVPAHVAQEYCRTDRVFSPCPSFNEGRFPRNLFFYNWATRRDESWFPLEGSNSGLGFDYAIICAGGAWVGGGCSAVNGKGIGVHLGAEADLEAITRLDEVRTADITKSHEHLNPTASTVCSM